MNVLLLVLLLAMLFFAYYLAEKNILSAWLISIMMFVFSTAIVVAFDDYFYREISERTIIIILLALLSWGVGEIFAKIVGTRLFGHMPKGDVLGTTAINPIEISKWPVLFITIFVILFSIYKYYNLYKVSLVGGNNEGVLKAAKYARSYIIYKLNGVDPTSNVLTSQFTVISECVGYFFGYVFLYNLIWCRRKDFIYLWPTAAYCLVIISSTGRVDYVMLAAVLCIIAFVFIKARGGWTIASNKKILKIALISIIAIMVVFRLTGYLTDKSVTYSVGENLAKYTGGGIIGLDIFLEKPSAKNVIYGQETLRPIYMLLREWGFNIPWYSAFPPFYLFGLGEAFSSNGYSGLMEPIKDYGVVGLLVTRLILGTIYGFVIERIRIRKREELTPLRLIILGLAFYPVAMCAIGDVFGSLFGTAILYKILYLYLMQRFLLPKQKKKPAIRLETHYAYKTRF